MTVLRTAALAAVAYATTLGAAYVAGAAPRHRAEAGWIVAAVLSAVALTAGGRRSNPEPEIVRRPDSTWTLAAFVALSLLLFAPTIGAGFFSDDFVLLARAETGSFSMGTSFFRPLPMAIWSALLATFGHAPLVFHLVNVVLHGVNAHLVWIVGRGIGVSRSGALLAGALFLVHPVGVEAVAWVSALFDVAATCGTLLFVVGVLQGRSWWQWGGLAVAFLSKESAVAAPLIGLLLAYPVRRQLAAAFAGLLVLGVAVALRVWWLPVPEEYAAPPSRYVIKELISRTFGTLAAPWSASDTLWPVLLPIAATASIGLLVGIAIARASDRRPRLLFLTAAVLLSVLPVYRYFFISPDMENARYLYMGASFWAMALASMADTRPLPAAVHVAGAVLLAVTLGAFVAANLARQRAWIAAGELRDRVLADVTAVVRADGCGRVTVGDLPDALGGVYVFRNGFAEAVEQAAGPLPPGGPECFGNWDGKRLERVR
jgi:hypothetical protein